MTGMAAADLMLHARIGMLRTVPPPEPDRLERLRLTAKALRVEWPKDVSYQEFVRGLSPFVARQAALLVESAGLLRGSGYVAFDGGPPKDPVHSPLASTYSHTTAPLRRLVDRYVGEACVALSAGAELPEWACAELPTLPETMATTAAERASTRRESSRSWRPRSSHPGSARRSTRSSSSWTAAAAVRPSQSVSPRSPPAARETTSRSAAGSVYASPRRT